MFELSLFVPGYPVPKQSFRVLRKGGGYISPRVTAWQELVGLYAKRAMIDQGQMMTASTVEVDLTFDLPHKRRFDLENLAKAVLDGMNKIVWDDDSQVTILHIRKRLNRQSPGVTIYICNQE